MDLAIRFSVDGDPVFKCDQLNYKVDTNYYISSSWRGEPIFSHESKSLAFARGDFCSEKPQECNKVGIVFILHPTYYFN